MKILKHIMVMVALLLGFASCQEDDKIIFDSNNIINSELGSLLDAYTLTTDNFETTEIKFVWKATDFGINLETDYTLEFSTKENNFEYIKVLASTKDTTVTINGSEIVGVLQFFKKDLGLDITVAQDYVFRVKATITDDNFYYSTLSSTKISAFVQRIEYPEVWVIGDYSSWGWDEDKGSSNLFDFKNDKNYEGIIFFNSKAANGFKITGAMDWNNGNYGIDNNAGAPDTEANSIQLIDDGGSGNISIYSKNYYKFRFNEEDLTLTKLMSFDSFGITGSAVGANDLVMNFDNKYQDFVLTANLGVGEIYFRADGQDNIAYGASAVAGYLNDGKQGISVSAGVYEIAVNINNSEELTYSLKAKATLDPSKITAPVVTAKDPNIVYAKTSEDKIEWAAVDFQGQEATKVSYSVELDLKDANFANAIVLGTTENTELTISGQTYMDKIAELGGDAESSADIEIRVIANVETLSEEFISNTVVFNLTIKNEVALPTYIYVQGSFAGWDWESENIKTMIPVNGTSGIFWIITYFDANTEFKFSPVKNWNGGFGFESANIEKGNEYNSGENNGKTSEAGYYMLVVKCEHTADKQSFIKKIVIAEPIIQLMGDTSPSGWTTNANGNFTYDSDSDTWTSPAFVNSEAKDIRMFANLAPYAIGGYDWWKSEFIILEGKIAYRGNGGDQTRVQGTQGQFVKLNFKDGTGVIE